jgi:hypothetical protein
MNKKLLVLLVGVLFVAAPAMAQEDEFSFELSQMRYRFNHFVQDLAVGETCEFFDDDFDTKFTFKKGEVQTYFELEIADSAMGDDKLANATWDDVLGAYGAKWTPESMADSAFSLQVGDFGTGFGKNVNNDDSPRGSMEVSWKMGEVSVVLGYGRVYEGFTNDDVEGDGHLVRGQVDVPLGESGFSVGAYAAMYAANDIILQGYAEVEDIDYTTGTVTVLVTPEVTGGYNAFLGSLEMAGSVSSAEVYAETGFAAGSLDIVDEVLDVAAEGDLSGFYGLGGAKFSLGQVTLGIEAGFGTGDDPDTGDEDEGFLGFNNDFGLGEIIEDELAGGLSNKLYGKLSADLSPTEKISLNVQAIYVKPVEDVEGANGTMVDTYGFEFNSTMTYKLADYLNYVLMGAVASLEEDWLGESSAFQMMNRLQFNF